jgi:hypothetical protein
MATFDNVDGSFPDSADLSVGTSEVTLEIPTGATFVYAQNKGTGGEVVTFAPRASSSIALSVASASPTLIWSGPAFGGHRNVYLKSDTASTAVDVVAFSTVP